MLYNPLFLFRNRPQLLIFFVTARCDCRCRFCFYRRRVENPRAEEELTLEEIESFSRLYGPLADLSISGGEPFLRKDLEDIVRTFAVNNRPKLIEIPTNGYRPEITAGLADAICRDFPGIRLAIQISADGPPQLHDQLRQRPGLFERARETSRMLEKISAVRDNLNVQIVSVFSEDSRGRLEEFYRDWADKFFFHRLVLTPCVDESYQALVKGEDRKLYRRLEAAVEGINRSRRADRFSRFSVAFHRAKETAIGRWEKNRNLGRYCRAGKSILVLRENGDLSPCEPAETGFGNIRDYGYATRRVLKGKPARDYFANYRKIRTGCHCSWSCAQTCAFLHSPRCLFSMLFRCQQATDFSPPGTGQKRPAGSV